METVFFLFQVLYVLYFLFLTYCIGWHFFHCANECAWWERTSLPGSPSQGPLQSLTAIGCCSKSGWGSSPLQVFLWVFTWMHVKYFKYPLCIKSSNHVAFLFFRLLMWLYFGFWILSLFAYLERIPRGCGI